MTDVLITAGELAEFLTKEPCVVIDTRNPEAYGAGHFADMQDRLLKDFELKRSSEKWLIAWSLEKAAPKKEESKPEPKKVESKKDEPKAAEKK